MSVESNIQEFLTGSSFAVVGASQDRSKYGNKVLRAYQQRGLTVYPINPRAVEIEGLTSYPNLTSVLQPVDGISVIIPPHATLRVVQEAIKLGIKNVWMQPGAESDESIELAEQAGLNVIARGPCLLVVLRFDDSR